MTCYHGHMPEPDISLPDPFCGPARLNYINYLILLHKSGGLAFQDILCFLNGIKCRILTCRDITIFRYITIGTKCQTRGVH